MIGPFSYRTILMEILIYTYWKKHWSNLWKATNVSMKKFEFQQDGASHHCALPVRKFQKRFLVDGLVEECYRMARVITWFVTVNFFVEIFEIVYLYYPAWILGRFTELLYYCMCVKQFQLLNILINKITLNCAVPQYTNMQICPIYNTEVHNKPFQNFHKSKKNRIF